MTSFQIETGRILFISILGDHFFSYFAFLLGSSLLFTMFVIKCIFLRCKEVDEKIFALRRWFSSSFNAFFFWQ